MTGNYNDQTAVAGWTCANCYGWVPADESHTCPTVPREPGTTPLDGWTAGVVTLKKHREFAPKAALLSFEEKLAEYQVQMPAGFTELVDKHFWELIK